MVYSSHLNWGGEARPIQPAVINWRPGKFLLKIFNDTVSREEHKSIFSSLSISEITLSNQSHFPEFFLSPGCHLIGVCKSYQMASACPACHLPASPNHRRWHAGAWLIPAYDKQELGRPRYAIFCDLVMAESQLGKPEKMIWWNQLPRVIFWGRAIPAFPKPELIGIFKMTFRGPGKWL